MTTAGKALLANTASCKKVKVILTNLSGKVLMTKQITGIVPIATCHDNFDLCNS